MTTSMGKPCAQCGQPLTEGARVCTQCGFSVAQTPPTQPQPSAAQTMLGFTSPLAPPTAPTPPPPPPEAPAPQAPPKAPAMASTMLGFAAPAELRALVPRSAEQPAQPVQQIQHPAPQPFAPAASPAGAKTMLGVAMPGIAPVHAQPTPAPTPQQMKGLASGTMMGVAMPGIAPLHAQPGAPPIHTTHAPAPRVAHEPPPPIVPAPAPLLREAAPLAPSVATHRRGMPIAVVAVVASVVVLAGGVALLWFSHGAPPMTATAKVAADGKEQLHLRCESCADGTTATWKGAKTTFAKKEADIDLPTPLAIGDNAFQIAIDRPGVGRDETVKLVLPLAYRIRGDLSDIAAAAPAIKVDVEAQPGATVTVDGKSVALDAAGKASLPYDVTTDTSGPSDETRTIERKIPYEVIDKDKKKSTGDVVVRVAVLPLHVDAPGALLVTDEASVWIAGRTSKGASVTANGASIATQADGTFEGKVDVAPGAGAIAIRTSPAADAATKVAPRTMTVNVTRDSALDAQAKSLDKAASLGFDAMNADLAGSMGRPVVVAGSVLESRDVHHHTTMLVDDKRGCAKGPCIVRVDFGADTSFQAGDAVAAYGSVTKSISTPDGKTLPTVDATLVRKAGKR